jgi:hypothetical protein
MRIFNLPPAVLAKYRDFVRSFLLISDERARTVVDRALKEEDHPLPEPMVQQSPAYAVGPRVDERVREG